MQVQWSVLIPVVAALVGAVLGSVLGELRTLLEGQRERRRVLNTVLFHQLEIWHSVVRTDLQGLVAAVRRNLEIAKVPPGLLDFLFRDPRVVQMLAEWVGFGKDGSAPELYEEAVRELAPVEPLLAFRLRGRPALAAYETAWKQFVGGVVAQQNEDDAERERPVREQVMQMVSGLLLNETLGTLEDDLDQVSRAIGWRMRRQVRAKVRKVKSATLSDAEVQPVIEILRRLGLVGPV